MELAWHIAALMRTKKFPKLKSLLSGAAASNAKKPRRTWEEQVGIALQWNATLNRKKPR